MLEGDLLRNVAFEDLSAALPARLSIDDAYAISARKHGLSVADLKSRRRYHHVCVARFEGWAMLRAQGWSLPAIARAVDRDHTSVLSGLRKISAAEFSGHGERCTRWPLESGMAATTEAR